MVHIGEPAFLSVILANGEADEGRVGVECRKNKFDLIIRFKIKNFGSKSRFMFEISKISFQVCAEKEAREATEEAMLKMMEDVVFVLVSFVSLNIISD